MATELVSGRDGILTQICISKAHFFPIFYTPFFGQPHNILALYPFYIILHLSLCAMSHLYNGIYPTSEWGSCVLCVSSPFCQAGARQLVGA